MGLVDLIVIFEKNFILFPEVKDEKDTCDNSCFLFDRSINRDGTRGA
jgi:hypothetical protein